MKHVNKIFALLIACVATSCTFAIYVQKNSKNSTQEVSNPTSASVDSTTITVTNPLKVQ